MTEDTKDLANEPGWKMEGPKVKPMETKITKADLSTVEKLSGRAPGAPDYPKLTEAAKIIRESEEAMLAKEDNEKNFQESTKTAIPVKDA